MAKMVVLGAATKCSMGAAPGKLLVIVPPFTITMPIATIMDFVPMMNILPFGMCKSTANPMVIALTAAALGVLTPAPCIPMTVAPWSPGASKVKVGGKPALLATCKANCIWGGSIEITDPGQTKVEAK